MIKYYLSLTNNTKICADLRVGWWVTIFCLLVRGVRSLFSVTQQCEVKTFEFQIPRPALTPFRRAHELCNIEYNIVRGFS